MGTMTSWDNDQCWVSETVMDTKQLDQAYWLMKDEPQQPKVLARLASEFPTSTHDENVNAYLSAKLLETAACEWAEARRSGGDAFQLADRCPLQAFMVTPRPGACT
jgi:hypothetical protein